jgi:hypothetical protein
MTDNKRAADDALPAAWVEAILAYGDARADKNLTEGIASLNKAIKLIRAALSGRADGGKDSSDALADDEADDFIQTVDEFGDTGETMTDYDMLMDWARRGLLECTHFEVTEAGHKAIDDAIAKGASK